MSVELGSCSDQLGAHCLQLVGVGTLAISSFLQKVFLEFSGLGERRSNVTSYIHMSLSAHFKSGQGYVYSGSRQESYILYTPIPVLHI